MRKRLRRLVSWSEIECFLNCERQHFYKYVQKRPRRPSPTLEIGSTYHTALEQWFTTADPVDLAEAAVDEHGEALRELGVNVPGLVEELAANVTRMREFWEKRFWKGPPIKIEQKVVDRAIGFSGVVDSVWDYRLETDEKGQLLGVAEGGMVLDYKSLTSDRRRSQRDAMLSGQLALYAHSQGVNHAGFVEIPRNLQKEIRIRVVEFTNKELQDWLRWFASLRNAIMRRYKRIDNFHMCDRKNALCCPMWCDFYGECYGD